MTGRRSTDCACAAGVSRATPPARVEAETGDAEFLEESEVFREVCVVHRATSGSKRTTRRRLDVSSRSPYARLTAAASRRSAWSRMRDASSVFGPSGKSSSPSALMMRRRVRFAVEAGVGPRDVVGDDHVDGLPAQLLAAARDGIAALGREANQHRPWRAAASMPELGKDVSGRHQTEFEKAIVLLDLAGLRALGGRVVGDRRGHHDHVGIAGDGLHRVVHFGGTADPDHLDACRRIESRRPRHEHDARAAPRGLGGQRHTRSSHSIGCRYTGRRRYPRRSARR